MGIPSKMMYTIIGLTTLLSEASGSSKSGSSSPSASSDNWGSLEPHDEVPMCRFCNDYLWRGKYCTTDDCIAALAKDSTPLTGGSMFPADSLFSEQALGKATENFASVESVESPQDADPDLDGGEAMQDQLEQMRLNAASPKANPTCMPLGCDRCGETPGFIDCGANKDGQVRITCPGPGGSGVPNIRDPGRRLMV